MNSLIRSALILAGALAAPAILSAQSLPASATVPVADSTNGLGPVIKFNTEDYDFGKIILNQTVKYTFLMTNEGDATLDISNVKPSCGCTTVGAGPGGGSWTRQIAPHKSGVIPLEVHTSTQGKIDKLVTVFSNDGKRPSVVLHIRGVVWVPVEIIPAIVNFNLMPDSPSPTTTVVKIINRTDQPLTLSPPESTTNAFSPSLNTIKPGQEFELSVAATIPSQMAKTTGASIIQGVISMKTSAADMPLLNITTMASVQPEITILPPQIQVPSGPLAQAVTNWITIRGNTKDPLTLADAAVNIPGAEVSIRIMQTNRMYNLVVIFPKGFENKPDTGGMVSVKSDNPRFATINLPVTTLANYLQPRPRMVPPPAPPSSLATNAAFQPARMNVSAQH